MHITRKYEQATDFFCLTPGAVFEFEEDIYMRIDDIETADGDTINAVSLSTGEPECFTPGSIVYPHGAELVVS